MGRRALVPATIALVILGTTGTPAQAAAPDSPPANFTNPIAAQRADPHIFKHTDGFYYFTATVPAYDKIVMRRATTLQGLATAPETTIWTKHASGIMGAHIWASATTRSATPTAVRACRRSTGTGCDPLVQEAGSSRSALALAVSMPRQFKSNANTGQYGPGHNADGTPNLGIPVTDGATPVRFSSYDLPDRYIRHWEFRAKTEANVTNLADSQWRVVPGLAGTGGVSLESANFPGYYLRHKNFQAWVEKNDGTTLFKNDASFHQPAGLADPGDGVSFESLHFPGRYLRHGNDNLVYVQPLPTTADREDATYYAQ